jgi:peptidoglycan biosynthesis protein MviN/MurJ (putative lipid II flippase)
VTPVGTSTPAPPGGAAQPDVSGAPRGLVATDASTARSSVVVAASTLVASVFGGLLALVIVLIVGEGPDTDGFLAAYSAYLTFLLFGSTLRVALVPLLGSTADELAFRRHASATVRRLIAAALVMSALLMAASPLVGRALVPGAARHAQFVAAASIAVLAAAAWLQIWSAALSAVLAASRRFAASAVLYAASSAVTVALASVLMLVAGIIGAAAGIVGSAALLLVGHLAYLRRFGFVVRPAWQPVLEGRSWSLVLRAAAGAAVPVGLQLSLSIALAAVSRTPGAVTGYTYAYFIAVLISGVTSATVGLTTMPGLVRSLRERGRVAGSEYLDAVSPFSVLLYVPVAAAYAAFGHPLLELVLGGSLTPATLAILWDASRIFLVMALAWAVLSPLTTLALSLEMFGGLALISGTTVLVQVGLVTLASGSGPVAVAVAHAASGILLVLLALALVFRAGALRAGARAVGHCLPAGAFALVFAALAAAGLDRTPVLAILGCAVGTALYMALAIRFWPSVAGQALRLLRSRT